MNNKILLYEILPGAPVDIVPVDGTLLYGFKLCGNCGIPHCRITTRGPNALRFASYCGDCHNAYMRATRPKYSELTPLQKMKANARSYAHVYRDRGIIQRQPCGTCGSDKAEMHHEDYTKPTEVHWLCRDCHLDLHRSEYNG